VAKHCILLRFTSTRHVCSFSSLPHSPSFPMIPLPSVNPAIATIICTVTITKNSRLFSAQNAPKHVCGQGSARTPLGGAYVTPTTDFEKKFTGRFLGKFVVIWILKIPTHLHMLVYYLVKHSCQQNKPLMINHKVYSYILKVWWGC